MSKQEEFLSTFVEQRIQFLTGHNNVSDHTDLQGALDSLGESRSTVEEMACIAAHAATLLDLQELHRDGLDEPMQRLAKLLYDASDRVGEYAVFLESFGESNQTDEQKALAILARLAASLSLAVGGGIAEAVKGLKPLIETERERPIPTYLLRVLALLAISMPERLVRWGAPQIALESQFDAAEGSPSGFTQEDFRRIESTLDSIARSNEVVDGKYAGTSDAEDIEPTLEWHTLFAGASRLLSNCSEIDTSGRHPLECGHTTAQYWAWKFGHYAARFANCELWKEDPYDGLSRIMSTADWKEDAEWCFPEQDYGNLRLAAFTVLALLVEHENRKELAQVRDRLRHAWSIHVHTASPGLSLEDLSPVTDLYWALRLGFVDTLSESDSPTARKAVQPQTFGPSLVGPALDLREQLERNSLWSMKILEDNKRRMGSTPEEIDGRLNATLGAVLDTFDSGVAETLRLAERHFEKLEYRYARLKYVETVELALSHRLVDPLCQFLDQKGLRGLEMPYMKKGFTGLVYPSGLGKYSLADWGSVLTEISSGKQTPVFQTFTRETYSWNRQPDLRRLARILRDLQTIRGGSAHAQHAMSQRERSVQACREARDLLLGQGGVSVLALISQSFRIQS